MKFTTDASQITRALSVITKVASPNGGVILFKISGKRFEVITENSTNMCSFKLPVKFEGGKIKDRVFTVGSESIKSSLRGHQEVEITLTDDQMIIKDGRYKAELSISDAESISVLPEGYEADSARTLSNDVVTWLINSANQVALRPTLALTPFMPLGIKITDKGAFIACYDQNHMAFTSTKKVKGSLEATLPLDTFLTGVDAVSKTEFKIDITETSIIVFNKQVTAAMSLPQVDSELAIPLDSVMEKAEQVPHSVGVDLDLPIEDLMTFLENARSIQSGNVGREEIECHASGTKVSLKVENAQGRVFTSFKSKVKASKEIVFRCDYSYLEEVSRKAKDSLFLTVVEDSFMLAKINRVSVLIALNNRE